MSVGHKEIIGVQKRAFLECFSSISQCSVFRVGIRLPFLVERKFHGTGVHGTEPMEPNGTIVPLRVTSKEEELASINPICDTHLVRVS